MVKMRDRIFIFICLCMPFLCTPKILNMDFIGGPVGRQLILYPILFLFIYTVYAIINRKYTFISIVAFKRYLAVFVVTLLFSAIMGIIIFPYYEIVFNGSVKILSQIHFIRQ